MLNSTLQFRPPSLSPLPRRALITNLTKAFTFRSNPIIKFEGLSFLRPLPLDFISELPPTGTLLVKAKPPTSDKSSEQKWVHEGVITESLPNGMFSVKLDNEDSIIGYISGKIRKNYVRILPGDRVRVEVSRYDTSKGRIVYRLRSSS